MRAHIDITIKDHSNPAILSVSICGLKIFLNRAQPDAHTLVLAMISILSKKEGFFFLERKKQRTFNF
jgi:hypothetical protein